jgi:hypothetical protein
MAKPSTTYPFATDVGATADPGSTRQATGFVAGKKAPSKWFNWLHKGAHDWFEYLDNLHNETEFLNKAYAWTGAHTFDEDVNFAVPRTYAKWIPLEDGQWSESDISVGFTSDGDATLMPRWTWAAASPDTAFVSFPVDLPTGATITGAKVVANAQAGHLVRARLANWAIDQTTGARTFTAIMRRIGGNASTSAAGTGGDSVYSLDAITGVSQLIDRAAGSTQLRVSIQDVSAVAASYLYGVWIQWTLPGYRNG